MGRRECFWTSLVSTIGLNSRRVKKKQHVLENCPICPTKYLKLSLLHTSGKMLSAAECNEEISTNLIEQVSSISLRKPSSTTVAKSLVDILNPVFQSNFQTSFETAMAESHNLSPKESSKDKRKSLEAILKDTTKSVSSCTQQNDKDLTVLLSSGKSFQQHDRERMAFFIPKKEALTRMTNKIDQELSDGEENFVLSQISEEDVDNLALSQFCGKIEDDMSLSQIAMKIEKDYADDALCQGGNRNADNFTIPLQFESFVSKESFDDTNLVAESDFDIFQTAIFDLGLNFEEMQASNRLLRCHR
ncbi:Hypothetical predicted protein [Mytilus galloprovincialis]|nr:Hypothetical predicted protein [Mytilus galloprovincialis]